MILEQKVWLATPIKMRSYGEIAIQNPPKTSMRVNKMLKYIFCGTPCTYIWYQYVYIIYEKITLFYFTLQLGEYICLVPVWTIVLFVTRNYFERKKEKIDEILPKTYIRHQFFSFIKTKFKLRSGGWHLPLFAAKKYFFVLTPFLNFYWHFHWLFYV